MKSDGSAENTVYINKDLAAKINAVLAITGQNRHAFLQGAIEAHVNSFYGPDGKPKKKGA